MKKILFNDNFFLTQAVLDGTKTMTRRVLKDNVPLGNWEETRKHLPYKVGEVIAIAQPYKDIIERLPMYSDAQGGAVKLTRGKRLRNGQVFSATLKDLVASKMLPTPQTQGLKVCNKDGKTEFLNLKLLPTPKAQEARGNCSVNRNKFNLTDKIAELTSPTSDASQLNPLFVTEMMGYPLEWLTLPFLLQNGEAKASKR